MQKDCLYKLIDEESYKYAANGLITLSRPVFEFKGSETKIEKYYIK